MTTTPAEVGAELPPVTMTSTLITSVLYAGASGDMNPLHFDPTFAAEVSPTGELIAHGMFAMGLGSRVLTEWVGDPEALTSLEVRFTKPWPVGTTATFTGHVTAVEDGVARVRLQAALGDGTVIMRGSGNVRV
jgi:acyl dehydratase